MAKILVVDDHPVNRQFLTKLLGYVHHTVLEAPDGKAALTLAQSEHPDLVITDIVMPNMDGPEFVRQMRRVEDLKQIPVIFYTASYRVPDARELAKECDAVQVMHKPAKPEDVLHAVSAALHQAEPEPQTRSNMLEVETLRLAALTELGLDLVRERSPAGLLRKFVQAVRYILNSAGAGAIITDSQAPQKAYAALTYKSVDQPGPPDPHFAAEELGKLVNWQPMARFVKPNIEPKILGLVEPIRTLMIAALPLPTHMSGTAWLFVADKVGSEDFTREDERLAVTLGTQLAVTFENARLHAEMVQRESLLLQRTRLAQLAADVGIALTTTRAIRPMLQSCTESFVKHLDAAFARIWTVNDAGDMLELQASAGMYTHVTGPHSRIPMGQMEIGLIAKEGLPHLSSDVPNDPRTNDHDWARREGIVAFAGYPLLIGEHRVGVAALFARHQLDDSVRDALRTVSSQIALGIERKKKEEALREAQQRLQHVVVSSPAVLFTLALEGEVSVPIWASANMKELLGFDVSETLNRIWWSGQVHPDDKDWVAAAIRDQLMKRNHSIVEYRMRHKKGFYRWIHSEKRLLRDQNGTPVEIIGSWSDVTDRKSAEEKVVVSRKRLHDVVTSSPAVLYTLKIDGERLYPNWISENVHHMMGYTSEEALVQNWWQENVHPEDVDWASAEVARKLFREDHLAHEHRFRHKDGAYHWIRNEMRLLRDKNGNPTEVVGSWSDVTQRKQLEEQFRQAQKMEAIGKLAGGVAHDFNNLLTVILGYSEIYIPKLREEDPLKVPLTEIRKAGERAKGLTRQLLAFSRKQVLMPVVLNLNAIIEEMEKMVLRLIGEDVTLTVHKDPDLWQIKADAGQMEQVVMNILVNARDAMPNGGKILIETKNVELDTVYAQSHAESKSGPHVLLAISDTGCGMDATVKARIFEPFFTTKGPTKGTGLGLATVFGIVKQSGGHIEVYSEVGVGTTFKIYLPRDGSGDPIAVSPRVKEPIRGGAETIMLVEDEDGLRNLAQAVLQSHGYTVLSARHGGDALLIFETHSKPIDLVITDVVMPHFSGRQLVERLEARQPNLKVLYMSGYTDDAIVHHGVLESGMPFLQKPFAPESLARKVREVLDTPEQASK